MFHKKPPSFRGRQAVGISWYTVRISTAGAGDCHAALRLAMTAEGRHMIQKRPRPKTGPLCDPVWAAQADIISNRPGDAVQRSDKLELVNLLFLLHPHWQVFVIGLLFQIRPLNQRVRENHHIEPTQRLELY